MEEEIGDVLIYRGANYLKRLQKMERDNKGLKRCNKELTHNNYKEEKCSILSKKPGRSATRSAVSYVGNPFIRRVSDIIFRV